MSGRPTAAGTSTPVLHRVRRTAGAVVGGTVLVALAPLGIMSAQAKPPTVSDWNSLESAVSAGRDVVLGADITHSGDTLDVSTKRPIAIDLNGHSLSITAGAGAPAVDIPAGAKLTVKDLVNSGSMTVRGGTGGAGIHVGPAATFAMSAYSPAALALTATGGTGAAGIGGNTGQTAGTILIHQGSVTAQGGTGAAGIGGGSGGAGGPVRIDHGNLISATGGTGGAGIGGGDGAAGGALTVDQGTVAATAGAGAAGIGSGSGGSAGGASVVILSRGIVKAEAASGGAPAITLGSLNNAGILQIPADSTLPVPDGVTAENSGKIRLYGSLTGPGTIHNSGLILPTPIYTDSLVAGDGQGPAGTQLLVSEHNYTLPFDLDGLGGTQPRTQHVYGKDIETAKQTLPPVPGAAGYTCADGWFTAATGGTQVLDDTLLSTVTAYGPSTLPLHRHCTADAATVTVTFNPEGGSPAPAAQTVAVGDKASEPADPTKANATFTGWFTAATNGTKWDFATDTVTTDITLYAQYAGTDAQSATNTASSSAASSASSSNGIAGVSSSRSASTSSGALSETGSDTSSILSLAVLLLGAGLTLLYLGRARLRTIRVRRH